MPGRGEALMGQADQQERRRDAVSRGFAQSITGSIPAARMVSDYLGYWTCSSGSGSRRRQPAPQPLRSAPASDRYANVDWRGPPQNCPGKHDGSLRQKAGPLPVLFAEISLAAGCPLADELGAMNSPRLSMRRDSPRRQSEGNTRSGAWTGLR